MAGKPKPDAPSATAGPRTLRIRVKPNARASSLDQLEDGTWLACVRSPPADGKANAELIALIAERFGVRRADVSIRSGASARLKTVRIEES